VKAKITPNILKIITIATVTSLVLTVIGLSMMATLGANSMDMAKNEAILHWFYIQAEDIGSLMDQYTSDAVLYWLGGPLNGVYHGIDNISTVWMKFFNAWEDEFVNVKNINRYTIGDKEYVVADVSFLLRSATTGKYVRLNLTYILVFTEMDGSLLIMEEWWIIRSAMPLDITPAMS